MERKNGRNDGDNGKSRISDGSSNNLEAYYVFTGEWSILDNSSVSNGNQYVDGSIVPLVLV